MANKMFAKWEAGKPQAGLIKTMDNSTKETEIGRNVLKVSSLLLGVYPLPLPTEVVTR